MNHDNDILQQKKAIVQETAVEEAASQRKKTVGWKSIALGQTVGVLLGAGIVHVVRRHAAVDKADTDSGDNPDATMVEVVNGDDNMPFEQVIADAMETVGENGVVTWRGGVYAACSQNEWMAKTETQREAITQQVSTEIPVDDIRVTDSAGVTSEQTEVAIVQQQEGCTMGDDGYVHVTDNESHDFMYVNNERIDISASDDVSVVGVGEDDVAGLASDVLDTDVQIVDVVDNVENIGDITDDVVVVKDDDTVTDDDVVGLDEENLLLEPMAFPIDDDMGTMQTEGFTDDAIMQVEILPLDEGFYNDGPVADGPMLDTR